MFHFITNDYFHEHLTDLYQICPLEVAFIAAGSCCLRIRFISILSYQLVLFEGKNAIQSIYEIPFHAFF